jgi:hypothetical protein
MKKKHKWKIRVPPICSMRQRKISKLSGKHEKRNKTKKKIGK